MLFRSDPAMDMGGADDLGMGGEEPDLGADLPEPDMEDPVADVGRARR